METIQYRGLLQLLREMPPPSPSELACLQSMKEGKSINIYDNEQNKSWGAKLCLGRFGATCKPSCNNKILIYDAESLIKSNLNTFQALTHYPHDNLIVIPEIVIDQFDKESKQEHKDAHKLKKGGTERHWKYVDISLSQEMKTILLAGYKQNIIIQRVNQVQMHYLKTNNVKKLEWDSHHIIACALYFRQPKVLMEVKKENVVMVTDDENLQKLAVAEKLIVYSLKDVENAQ